MLIKLEPRSVPSRTWQILSPVVALLATVIVGILLFAYWVSRRLLLYKLYLFHLEVAFINLQN